MHLILISSNSNQMNPTSNLKCRIAIIGSSQLRIVKVTSLLLDSHSSLFSSVYESKVEYLPCLATFDSYTNQNGDDCEYLAKIEYHGIDGKSARGSSLAPFFDDMSYLDETISDSIEDNKSMNQKVYLSGIAGVVIGCGIESINQINMIESFFKSFSVVQVIRRERFIESEYRDGTMQLSMEQNRNIEIDETMKRRNILPVILDHLRCNRDFDSLAQENEVYRHLSDIEKHIAMLSGTMGPGKMAKLIQDVTETIMKSYHAPLKIVSENPNVIDSSSSDTSSRPVIQTFHVREIDLDRVRFSCKLCRTYLFSEDDLENPPHFKAKHDFRNRKGLKSSTQTNICESFFICASLPWMGELSDTEGKLACPRCSCKVGQWNWSGTQCSCGTWVTPAIQIPKSRVDRTQ